jgi:hypothetical protein
MSYARVFLFVFMRRNILANVCRTRTKARLSSTLKNPAGLPRFCAAAVVGSALTAFFNFPACSVV